MKKIVFALVMSLTFSGLIGQQQFIPDVSLKTLNGENISSVDILDTQEATWLVFCNTNDRASLEYLETLIAACDAIKDKKKIRIITVYVECKGSWTSMKPIIDGFALETESYIDVNNDFKRALSIGNTPVAMLLDENQKLLCRYNSSGGGTEEYISNEILAYFDEEVNTSDYGLGR